MALFNSFYRGWCSLEFLDLITVELPNVAGSYWVLGILLVLVAVGIVKRVVKLVAVVAALIVLWVILQSVVLHIPLP